MTVHNLNCKEAPLRKSLKSYFKTIDQFFREKKNSKKNTERDQSENKRVLESREMWIRYSKISC